MGRAKILYLSTLGFRKSTYMSACKLIEVVVALASNARYSKDTNPNSNNPFRQRLSHVMCSQYANIGITSTRSYRGMRLTCLSTYRLREERWIVETCMQTNVRRTIVNGEGVARLHLDLRICDSTCRGGLVGIQCGLMLRKRKQSL